MIAINLLDNEPREVKQYKDVLYIEWDGKYYILKQVYILIDSIDEGHLFIFHTIGKNLYDGFWTTDYKAFVNEKQEIQLRLF